MEIIKLNLIPNGVNPTCHAKQYDKGRVIRFELFDGLTPYTLQSGDTVTLNLRKPDNTIIESSVTATQGNNYVDLVTTEQMCAVAGYNLGTFKIINGSVDIGTLNFVMAIERDVLADGNPSQSVIEDLDALVAESVRETLPDYKFPSDIYWSDNPLKDKLYRTYDGITTDFDVSELKPENGKTYYISPTGDDNNSGEDAEHPLTKLSTALAKSDVKTIICADGFYNINRVGSTFSKGVNIIAANGAHPIFVVSRDKVWSATSGYTKVYETTDSSSDITTVLDATVRDTDGDFLRYHLVNSVEEVENTENSYYISGSTIYAHHETAPIRLYVIIALTNLYATLSNGETLYIEGCEFVGGTYGGLRVTNGGTIKPTVLLKNCGFSNSHLGNALYLQGCKSVAQGCYASYGAKDGFNYHSVNDIAPEAIEINCIGRKNGTVGDNIDNGSTMHDGGKIIRLNCECFGNIGPNIADVNEDTMSFNYGVISHDSNGSSTNKDGFQIQSGIMWTDTCAAYNNAYDFRAEINGELRAKNCCGGISIADTSKLKAY